MEKFLVKKLLFIFLITTIFNSCGKLFPLKAQEDTVRLKNIYGYVNQTEDLIYISTTIRLNIAVLITVSPNKGVGLPLERYFPIDEDTSFSLVPVPDSNDTVNIIFLSTPPKCLVFQGAIPASSLDVRSHDNATDTVFTEEISFGPSEVGVTVFTYTREFVYNIDSTYLNQATEAICTQASLLPLPTPTKPEVYVHKPKSTRPDVLLRFIDFYDYTNQTKESVRIFGLKSTNSIETLSFTETLPKETSVLFFSSRAILANEEFPFSLPILDAKDSAFSLVPVLTASDTVKIKFLTDPPKCIVFKGEIPSNSLDTRSQENAADTTFFGRDITVSRRFIYNIDSTYLNQATEEACVE